MDLSSVLGKRLNLGVDKANVTAGAGSGKEAPAPFSFPSIKKRREGDANPCKATPINATAAAIGSGKETPAPFSFSSIKKSDEEEAQTCLRQRRLLAV